MAQNLKSQSFPRWILKKTVPTTSGGGTEEDRGGGEETEGGGGSEQDGGAGGGDGGCGGMLELLESGCGVHAPKVSSFFF